jgi:hypothetical protein
MSRKETKLNGYILPDSVKNDMRSVLHKTRRDEKGFALCVKDNIIMRGKDFVGDSSRIKTNLISGSCKRGERLLGLYHSHPGTYSHPSAGDLHNCGVFKTVCIGGTSDNKIMCHTFKGEQISAPLHTGILHVISQGATRTIDPKYQSNLDCINDTLPLHLAERYIKEKVDIDLENRELYLSSLREPDRSRPEIEEERMKLEFDKYVRNVRANILKKETKRQSSKYYNEIEIL